MKKYKVLVEDLVDVRGLGPNITENVWPGTINGREARVMEVVDGNVNISEAYATKAGGRRPGENQEDGLFNLGYRQTRLYHLRGGKEVTGWSGFPLYFRLDDSSSR